MGQSPAPVRTLRELEKKKLDSDSFLIPEADFFRRKNCSLPFTQASQGVRNCSSLPVCKDS